MESTLPALISSDPEDWAALVLRETFKEAVALSRKQHEYYGV